MCEAPAPAGICRQARSLYGPFAICGEIDKNNPTQKKRPIGRFFCVGLFFVDSFRIHPRLSIYAKQIAFIDEHWDVYGRAGFKHDLL